MSNTNHQNGLPKECDHINTHVNEKGICEGCGKQLSVKEVFDSIFSLKDKIIDEIKEKSK